MSFDQPNRDVPPKPVRPAEGQKPRGNPLGLILAAVAGLIVFAGLFVLLAQIAFALVVGLVLLILVASFHYFVWGQWISDSIRQEVEEEDQRPTHPD